MKRTKTEIKQILWNSTKLEDIKWYFIEELANEILTDGNS